VKQHEVLVKPWLMCRPASEYLPPEALFGSSNVTWWMQGKYHFFVVLQRTAMPDGTHTYHLFKISGGGKQDHNGDWWYKPTHCEKHTLEPHQWCAAPDARAGTPGFMQFPSSSRAGPEAPFEVQFAVAAALPDGAKRVILLALVQRSKTTFRGHDGNQLQLLRCLSVPDNLEALYKFRATT
jgi:hypothetical protein